nr:2-oxoglutarate and iron-dependent oxygenase domain-containing protein [uncultured Lichenicoccus sp.]
MLPVIDIAPLRSADESGRRAVAAALGHACREVGFFYVTGHGMQETTMQAMFAASRAFFAQPIEARRMLALSRVGNNRGYVELEHERLDLDAAPDRKQAFNIGLELPADHPAQAQPFRGVNAWPELPDFRRLMLSYYDACLALGTLIHRGFALDLDLPETFFDSALDMPMATLRLLHYPASTANDPGPGAGTHTDYGNLTILAVDGVAGLQVRRRDGVWLDAPHIPGAFVCNIGDCLMRWSNDTYVSTPHRVSQPASERYSIAFFLDPNPDAAVVPVLTGTGMVARYPAITGADFLRSRLDPTYGHVPAAP